MLPAPPRDPTLLLTAIREAYGLPVVDLAAAPGGEAARCYILSATTGARYFLKLWDTGRQGRVAVARLDSYLPLTRALYDRGLFRNLPYPLQTHGGAFHTRVPEGTVALFPFIAGHTLQFATPWPPPIWDKLARMIASMHRATDALQDVLPPRETFAIPFEAELRQGLVALETSDPRARPGRQALRDLLQPRRAEILALLDHLHTLQQAARATPARFVLCHTDIHGGNLLLDTRDQLTILDWENATVAPAEHDLQAFIGAGFGQFVQVYTAHGGMTPLHAAHFAFYLYRRYLADLTDWLLRILRENTTAAQDAHDLAGIMTECIARWETAEATIMQIDRSLRHSVELQKGQES